ncbi:MAG: cytochrome c biogenesis protein CcsA [Archaeoglobaceae archaeon]|nr:cytochrome c biogenesis protein CcsA [Archaeoglobaceae archaeon]MCX8151437.1 cytochrome c biogenesis protein CcsA [Archaeoglobaceae archaeon]MDW8014199.1 cytochrome c biogenesis protein CcsA [Archaeoglobaceae archaeon]
MEVGNVLLLLSLISSFISTTMFFIALKKKNSKYAETAEIALYFSLSSCFASLLILIYYFLTDNFLIEYVYSHSHKTMNVLYKISAVWAGKEGSLLIWSFFSLLIASLFVSYGKKDLEWLKASTVLTGIASYILLITFLESPFHVFSFKPSDGFGLNPILRTFEMILHPPIIFLAYALAAVPFSMHISNLNAERFAKMTFLLLSLGIFLGGFWAYKTLGWGGFWAWDPVENSSLLPWLSILAYLHSKKARSFFAYLTFVFVILATYITRSGIVQSPHAFVGAGGELFLLLIVAATVLAYRNLKTNFDGFCYTSQIFLAMIVVLLMGIFSSIFYNVSVNYYYFTFLPLFALSVILILLKARRAILIHLGAILIFAGAISVWGFEKSYDLTLNPSAKVSDIELRFSSLNFSEDDEKFVVRSKIESNLAVFEPEIHFYRKPEKVVQTVNIVSTPLFDYYLVMEQFSNEFVKVKFSIIPLISLVWLGCFFIVLGVVFRLLKNRGYKFII